MTNHRLTIVAAIAVIAAALSLYSVLQGNAWMLASIGATIVVAVAGTLTRLATIPAAIVATAATALVLVPPLIGYGWLGRIAALALVLAVAASATGARLARALATPVTYVSFLLLYLTLLFARGQAFVALIPSSRSVSHLARLPSQASGDFHYAPPVPTTRPVDFIAAAGVGIVAILVDLLAARLRRPAIAGLPLLLLFSVPVASSLKGFGVYQTLTFGAAIAAYLALLSADGKQRLRMWGRLVTLRQYAPVDPASTSPDTRELAASGRRVGLAAVCVAMVIPVILINGKPHDLFKKSADGTGGPGGGGIGVQLTPLLKVEDQLTGKAAQVFTYTTDASDPTQQYFQDYVLNYNAHENEWLVPTATNYRIKKHRLPDAVPGLAATTFTNYVKTTVDLRQAGNGPLPLPYAPAELYNAGTDLSEAPGTLMVFDGQESSGLKFTVYSDEADPTKNDLNSIDSSAPTSIQQAYGSYTGPDRAQLTTIARRYAGTSSSNLHLAVALQHWFTAPGNFTYTTKPAGWMQDRDWLLEFLTVHRSGDCEQFAPAFAVLARLLGIPSRVVVGYTGGSYNPGTGKGTVTTADAHAWPELYFPNVGWVRFEPTTSGSPVGGGQGTATSPSYTVGTLPPPPAASTGPSGSSSSSGPSTKASAGTSHKLTSQGGQASTTTPTTSAGQGFPVGLAVAIVILLLLALPGGARWVISRRRWMAASGNAALAHAAWRELTDCLTDYGLPGPPSESPRATAARIVTTTVPAPSATEAVRRIGAAEERARYSLGTMPGSGLRADVQQARKAIAESCSWQVRLRARLLPPSTVAIVRIGMQSANHALSWIDNPLPSMRRQPRPPARQTS